VTLSLRPPYSHSKVKRECEGKVRTATTTSSIDFDEACELKWEPYRRTSSLRSRGGSLSLVLPHGLLPPLQHSATPAQHS
jgi:hypothetical protein